MGPVFFVSLVCVSTAPPLFSRARFSRTACWGPWTAAIRAARCLRVVRTGKKLGCKGVKYFLLNSGWIYLTRGFLVSDCDLTQNTWGYECSFDICDSGRLRIRCIRLRSDLRIHGFWSESVSFGWERFDGVIRSWILKDISLSDSDWIYIYTWLSSLWWSGPIGKDFKGPVFRMIRGFWSEYVDFGGILAVLSSQMF